MLIVMKTNATAREVDAVVDVIQAIGLRAHSMPGATRTAIGITGNEAVIDSRRFQDLPGVAEVIRVTKPYKLITLDLRPEKTIVQVGDATIGEKVNVGAGTITLRNRESRAGVGCGGGGERKRSAFFPRRRVEAPHFALFVPGVGREGMGNNGGNPRNVPTQDRYRGPR